MLRVWVVVALSAPFATAWSVAVSRRRGAAHGHSTFGAIVLFRVREVCDPYAESERRCRRVPSRLGAVGSRLEQAMGGLSEAEG